jgi:hypothetical protein
MAGGSVEQAARLKESAHAAASLRQPASAEEPRVVGQVVETVEAVEGGFVIGRRAAAGLARARSEAAEKAGHGEVASVIDLIDRRVEEAADRASRVGV